MVPSKSYFVIVIFFFAVSDAFQFKSLEFYAQLLNGDFLESSPFGSGGNVAKSEPKAEETEKATVPRQTLQSSLYDFITYEDHRTCSVADENDPDGTNPDGSRKSPPRLKCIPVEGGNGTLVMVSSLKEVASIIAPHGNSTKRNEPGRCAVMLFYARTCIHSAMVALHFNALARHFPDLTVAAIDAHAFHVLNAEFGIVGLPTIMFIHSGRPLLKKYNGTSITLASLAKFVTQHSGVEPRLANQKSSTTVLHYISDDFKGPLSHTVEHRTDYWLYMAWIFIVICGCYYFSKSSLYARIIEMIKRNWRESAAHNG